MIVLVGCGGAKQDEAAPARSLYTSNYFQKNREYAEIVAPDRWFVVSAKHGCLPPDLEIEPYDVSIDDLDTEERRDLGRGVSNFLTAEVARTTPVELLMGREYADVLEAFLVSDRDVSRPFDETGGIGEQMALVDDMIEEARDGASLDAFASDADAGGEPADG